MSEIVCEGVLDVNSWSAITKRYVSIFESCGTVKICQVAEIVRYHLDVLSSNTQVITEEIPNNGLLGVKISPASTPN